MNVDPKDIINRMGRDLHTLRTARISLVERVQARPTLENVSDLLSCVARIDGIQSAIISLRPDARMAYMIGPSDDETLERAKRYVSETAWLDRTLA